MYLALYIETIIRYITYMTKLITCPVCKEPNKPVRDDAQVCSSKCRLKKWRKNKKLNEDKK